MDILLLFAAFVAGFLTVLAPCILPLLPVIIGSSLSGNEQYKRNPYLIIGSLALSIVAFTLIIQGLSSLFYIPESVWRYFSGTMVLIVGVSFLFPALWAKLPIVSKLSISSNKSLGTGFQRKDQMGDVIIGASLGPVFTSCSPTYFLILASVLPKSFIEGFIYLLAYTVGFSLILLLIVLIGERVTSKIKFLASGEGKFKKIVGVLIVASAILLYTGWDKEISTFLLENDLFIDTTELEQDLLNQ